MNVVGIIPARYASSRLVGKALAIIGGKPMIQHTYENAIKSKLLTDLIVAVDDKRVYEVVRSFGGKVIMTDPSFESGSDRIAFVAKILPNADIIVNIQGDEPFIVGDMIDQAIEPFIFDKKVKVSTLVKRIYDIKEIYSESTPKVVFDLNNNALYFSRSPIPFVRDAKTKMDIFQKGEFYKHIGLYVYKKDVLLKFSKMKPSDLEKLEKLEQLRFLENGIPIKIVVTEFETFSVDTPEDLNKAIHYYNKSQNN